MTIKGQKHISLKEAAEISGYSQDYLGQLIRKGKLPGKKVYVNVAWMTTSEDLQRYMKGSKNGNGGTKKGTGKKAVASANAAKARSVMHPGLYFLAGFLGAAVFALFYILSVNVDSRLEQRAVEQAAAADVVEMSPMPEAPIGIEAGLIEL